MLRCYVQRDFSVAELQKMPSPTFEKVVKATRLEDVGHFFLDLASDVASRRVNPKEAKAITERMLKVLPEAPHGDVNRTISNLAASIFDLKEYRVPPGDWNPNQVRDAYEDLKSVFQDQKTLRWEFTWKRFVSAWPLEFEDAMGHDLLSVATEYGTLDQMERVLHAYKERYDGIAFALYLLNKGGWLFRQVTTRNVDHERLNLLLRFCEKHFVSVYDILHGAQDGYWPLLDCRDVESFKTIFQAMGPEKAKSMVETRGRVAIRNLMQTETPEVLRDFLEFVKGFGVRMSKMIVGPFPPHRNVHDPYPILYCFGTRKPDHLEVLLDFVEDSDVKATWKNWGEVKGNAPLDFVGIEDPFPLANPCARVFQERWRQAQ